MPQPETVTTTETFPKNTVKKSEIEVERKLRIKAGAIKSRIESDDQNWILKTEWNVIGGG